jgi:Coenzyme PQQ synthesis protein D (PqqD)
VNPTGGRMLAALDEVGNVREAAARLAGEYDQPLEQIEVDLCEFCEALSERGLIELEPPE